MFGILGSKNDIFFFEMVEVRLEMTTRKKNILEVSLFYFYKDEQSVHHYKMIYANKLFPEPDTLTNPLVSSIFIRHKTVIK